VLEVLLPTIVSTRVLTIVGNRTSSKVSTRVLTIVGNRTSSTLFDGATQQSTNSWRFPSVDGKTHCALNCSTYSICHTSKRSREARLQNYRHSKLVKSSSPVCIQNGLITLVS
jgi:hypothetical protein